jgi:hypothetical protein
MPEATNLQEAPTTPMAMAIADRAPLVPLIEAAVQANPLPGVFGSAEQFDLGQRMARALAASDLVPTQYRDKLANCLIALDIAMQRRISPLTVMQNMAIIQGRPAWNAQFIIASINACGLFSPLRYEWRGSEGEDAWGCRAYAYDARNGERLDGSWITIALAKAEGWHGRQGSKWQTMPEQMLRYRAGAFFGRIYAGHVTLGLPTIEEVVDAALPEQPRPLRDLLDSPNREFVPGREPLTPAGDSSAPIADEGVAADRNSRIPSPSPRERQEDAERARAADPAERAPRARGRRRSAVETGGTPAVEATEATEAAAPVSAAPAPGAASQPFDSGLEPAPHRPRAPADTVLDTDPF